MSAQPIPDMSTRDKILFTAQKLFFSQGYESTSIQSLIDAVGIAKGTFYHHFKSKEEVVDALADALNDRMKREVGPVFEDDSLDALEKLNRFFFQTGFIKSQEPEMIMVFVDFMIREDSSFFRNRLQKRTLEQWVPKLQQVPLEGAQTGQFKLGYPEDSAELLMELSTAFSEQMARTIKKIRDQEVSPDRLVRQTRMYAEALHRLLGLEPGQLNLYREEQMTTLIQAIVEHYHLAPPREVQKDPPAS